jgi:cell division transport system ATP-binding protein
MVEYRAASVIEQVGLWRRRFMRPPQLSGGEQQRVAIARALANSPSLFVADEPTGNLDLRTSEEIVKILLAINAAGVTVVMTTHNQFLVDAYRQRVVELAAGRVVRDEHAGRYSDDDV